MPVSPGSRYNYGNRSTANRTQYRPEYVSPNHAGNRGGDRFRDRRHEFRTGYSSVYPAWLGYGYPYELNPGFLNWGDNGDSTDEQGSVAPGYPDPYLEPDYGAPSGVPGPGEPVGNLPDEEPGTAAESQLPLKVIFKDGRAAETIENYMMTATVLTDLDSQHYERIPMDEIDVAATQQANRANGVDFQIPNSPGD
jgi:hypothetical protein